MSCKVDVSGGLALDTFDAARKGSKQAVIAPGKSDKSLLLDLLTTSDVKRRMPLDAEPLPKEKIALIQQWIDAGAKEGTPPVETTPSPAFKKPPTRKLDMRPADDAVPPAGVLGAKTAGKLELAMKIGPLAPVTAVAFSPDNKLLAAGSYGQVIVWDLADREAGQAAHQCTRRRQRSAVQPRRGDILAVGGGQPSAKGDLRLYQVSDWKLLAVLRGHDDVVFSLAFSPDGKQLASASFDHTVRLWDVQDARDAEDLHHHSDFVYAVAFSPDGKRLVSASKDRTVQLFDAADRQERLHLQRHGAGRDGGRVPSRRQIGRLLRLRGGHLLVEPADRRKDQNAGRARRRGA